MSKFSTVYNFKLDISAILELEQEVVNTIPESNYYMHKDPSRTDIVQDILMLSDLSCLEKVKELLSPIQVLAEHSIGFESVPANEHVLNHNDFLLGWGNPFTRKCNLLFNLEDHPIYITHGKEDESKYIMPGQVMALNVQLSHGCDHRDINVSSKMFSINLRKNYFDTVTYLNTILL
jgi:hypothetical protein